MGSIIFQLLLCLVLPVVLILLGVVPLNQRGLVLGVTVIGIVLLAVLTKTSLKELGIRTDNLKKSWVPYSLFTLMGVMGLFGLANIMGKQPLSNWWTYSHLQWAFLPISLVQEFGYRAYFQTKLQKVINPYLAILIITLLYCAMHILWKDPLILIMTFVGGLGWGYLWYKYPNFYMIVLSHTILNFLAVFLGFFPWLVTEFFNLN